jgi:NAD(P)-dependent dehydrogenase (short-subunit alcohol dehydrogenase family)
VGERRAETAVAVVTGAGRGIGRAAALALAAAGHPVCVCDTGVALDGSSPDPGPARSVAAEIQAGGGTATAVTTDARTAAGARELVAGVAAWAGRPPTVLVHSAGTLRDAMVHKATDDDWAEVLGSHLSVAVELTRAMAPTIRDERFGRILYVGGAAGLVGSVGQAAYCVAKAGLFGLTRALALEMAGRDVCVNYLAPFAFTRMTESIPPVTDALRAYLATAPQARPHDLGPLVAWLCSPAAAGITGQVLGARGAEVAIWSQPRPVAEACAPEGWEPRTLDERARPGFEPHLTPLESEFDLFGGAPVPVTTTAPVTASGRSTP